MPFYRCKVCGFITNSESAPEICSACGAKTPFQEYTLPIDEKRWKLLQLHLHPISVHFPVAIALFSALFLTLYLIFPDFYPNEVLNVSAGIILIFPLFVLFAMFLGRIDAKLRFKRTNTPLLKKKIIFASLLFICALGMMIIVLVGELESLILLTTILAFISFGFAGILGFLGGQIINAHIPASKI